MALLCEARRISQSLFYHLQKSYLQRLLPISQWQICKLNAPKIQALLRTISVSSGPFDFFSVLLSLSGNEDCHYMTVIWFL